MILSNNWLLDVPRRSKRIQEIRPLPIPQQEAPNPNLEEFYSNLEASNPELESPTSELDYFDLTP